MVNIFNPKIIGIDIDDKEKGKKLLRILRILSCKGNYRLSSSKRGYHFRLKVNPHTKKENFNIRWMFGDCYGRLRGDFRRLKNDFLEFDVLFDVKNNKRSGKWKKI